MNYKKCVSCGLELEMEKAYETKKMKSCRLTLNDVCGNIIHDYDFYMCSKCIKKMVIKNKLTNKNKRYK